MKVGDLVQKRTRTSGCHRIGRLVGLVIEAHSAVPQGGYISYRVCWQDDYGTFWSDIGEIEIINENR